jgi:hypothetical protein
MRQTFAISWMGFTRSTSRIRKSRRAMRQFAWLTGGAGITFCCAAHVPSTPFG